MILSIFLIFASLTSIAYADISINNAPLSIQNNTFNITQELGQTIGNNLFHSFDTFNVNQGEIAHFSGANHIENIISRVTGGEASFINGTIRSSVPNADFYFLNPYGILFGESAKLELQGSFHASTADYLKLSDGGEFHATLSQPDILTAAPVEAFGFLSNSPAHLSINHSQLSVLENQTLSFTGGDLSISNATLSAPAGYIYLASVGKISEIIPNLTDIATLQGNINITQQSSIDTSGDHGGSIFIRSGQLVIDNSEITAHTFGNQNGEVIDIAANNISLKQGAKIAANVSGLGHGVNIKLTAKNAINAEQERADTTPNRISISAQPATTATNNLTGDGGTISLDAKNIYFQDGSSIINQTASSGQGGDIILTAEESVIFSGEGSQQDGYPSSARVFTLGQAGNSGKGGALSITANQVTIRDGAALHSRAFGSAASGDMHVKASNILIQDALAMAITFVSGDTGTLNFEAENDLRLQTGDIYNLSLSAGNAGDINVKAKNILLNNSSYIMSLARRTGRAGNIRVEAAKKLSIQGNDARDGWGWASGIHSNASPTQDGYIGGNGGHIHVKAGELFMRDGGLITAGARSRLGYQAGNGGDIDIEVTGAIDIGGVNPYGRNDEGFETGIYASSVGVGENGGNGGNIRLRAYSLSITNGGTITSSTDNHGIGGTIEINVRDSIAISGDSSVVPRYAPGISQVRYLEEFATFNQLTYSISGIYANSQDNSKNAGDAGNIHLTTQNLTLTDKGTISTSGAGGGVAGNIDLIVDQLNMDSSALITSENHFVNHYQFTDVVERDRELVATGDVVEVADLGNGEKGNFVNIGDYLIQTRVPIQPVETVQDLNTLSQQYRVFEGQIVEVKNAGNGASGQFIYTRHRREGIDTWQRMNDNVTATLDTPQPIFSVRSDGGYRPGEELPDYQLGERIRVKDMGDGKSADFIYANIFSPDNKVYVRFVRVNQFNLTDEIALNTLSEQVSLDDQNPIATVQQNGVSKQFIYANNQWIGFNNQHHIGHISQISGLILAKTGNIANIENVQSSQAIYTGQQWINLNPERRIVQTHADLAQLSAQQGDLVKVLDAGQYHAENYFFANDQWIKQERGGDAGTINIRANRIHLAGNSAITTEAISSGGGGMALHINQLLALTENSQISTSVQEGAGNGGNLIIGEPQFLILNHAQLVAQAYEGQGGNIRIVAEQFLKNPTSLVSASSQLGIDGNIEISSPDETISDGLLGLNKNFLEQAKLRDACQRAVAGQRPTEFEAPLTFKAKLFHRPNSFIGDWLPSDAFKQAMCKTLTSLNFERK
ncbi:filamentous hemagglutinin N-terminal domain-containing protein [Candidatus Albibeggiatoa sp. nov. NOAA]|uniref:two-partner secretion domain-containing protein n=1 Tax=Candidatus Albibeggiatoa sp. nov. NOAA TaxID=3162724 RepID=UPI003303A128|nr:filamentous hemagglutinin N-terminal domain-containing protein [Thiotrichaceae bacterium]